jgi:tRNA(fMet)-specific endonuclease VapC
MAIILDADVVIRGEKGSFDLAAWFTARRDDNFELAAVTLAELWHGVERAAPRQRTRRLNYLRAIVSALPIIPYTEQTAYEHARIWARLAATGKMIGAYDLIVAATALERDSEVATFNREHFNRIKGLRIIEPSL